MLAPLDSFLGGKIARDSGERESGYSTIFNGLFNDLVRINGIKSAKYEMDIRCIA